MIAITLYGSVPSWPDSLTGKALREKRFGINPQCGYMETGFLAIAFNRFRYRLIIIADIEQLILFQKRNYAKQIEINEGQF